MKMKIASEESGNEEKNRQLQHDQQTTETKPSNIHHATTNLTEIICSICLVTKAKALCLTMIVLCFFFRGVYVCVVSKEKRDSLAFFAILPPLPFPLSLP